MGIHFKFSCLFSCDIRKINCDLLSKSTKLGTSLSIMLKSSVLFLYAQHCVSKWIPFSTVDGQNGQKRSSLGANGRLCLPFSIMRQWSVFRKRYPEFSIFNISEIALKFHSVFKLSICISFWERVDLCLP